MVTAQRIGVYSSRYDIDGIGREDMGLAHRLDYSTDTYYCRLVPLALLPLREGPRPVSQPVGLW